MPSGSAEKKASMPIMVASSSALRFSGRDRRRNAISPLRSAASEEGQLGEARAMQPSAVLETFPAKVVRGGACTVKRLTLSRRTPRLRWKALSNQCTWSACPRAADEAGDFIAGLSAGAWPRAALAQLPQPVIGFLGSDREELRSNRFRAFHEALTEAGYTDGRNITIEFRWGDGEVSRFPELASDLVRRQVAVIASLAGIPSAKAAKEATSTIPIVFQGGFDPVEIGLVASLSWPVEMPRGVTNLGLELGPKRLEVMRELLPAGKLFALIFNPDYPNAPRQLRDMQDAARKLGVRVETVAARLASQDSTQGLRLRYGRVRTV